MVDSKGKDRLAEALRRAEAAIQKSNQQEAADDEGSGTELDLPEDSSRTYSPDSDFGAVQLEQSDSSLELGSQATENPTPRPTEDPVYVRPQPVPKPTPQRKKPKMPPAFTLRIPKDEQPKKTFPLKSAMLILGVICLLGAGVAGYFVWKKNLENERHAQLEALDQASIEAMKTEAAKKEQLGAP